MDRHERLLRIAYENTFRSDHSVYPMSAVLARGNKIISIGVNHEAKTHPKQKLRKNVEGQFVGGHKIHAELDALIRAPGDKIRGSSIYVARRLKNMDFAMAKPCDVCMCELLSYGVKDVYYTVSRSLTCCDVWWDHFKIKL